MIPDEAFIDQLRALLPHLEDNSYYQANPLIERLVPPQVLGAQQRIHALRAIIRECIAEMRPTQDTPLRSAKARSYSTLRLRYVDGLPPQEMARELPLRTFRQPRSCAVRRKGFTSMWLRLASKTWYKALSLP